jgi:CopG family nickel-responsive transcriptional regulator
MNFCENDHTMKTKPRRGQDGRFTVSLPPSLFAQLNGMVKARGYTNRSQAIAKMVAEQYAEFQVKYGDEIVAATVTLIYDHTLRGLQQKITGIQHRYIKEVISSLHVHLESNYSMEVVLLQGPGKRIKKIADQLITTRGVKNGRLYVTSVTLPPIY